MEGNLRVVVTTSLVMLGASLVSAALALANNYISVRVAIPIRIRQHSRAVHR